MPTNVSSRRPAPANRPTDRTANISEVSIIDPIQLLSPVFSGDAAKPVVAVAAAAESHVLQSVARAYADGIADFILFGDVAAMRAIAAVDGIDLAALELQDVPDPLDAAKAAVLAVREGRASALMKGLVETTPLLRAVLDKEQGIRGEHRLSHLAMFMMPKSVYPKPLFLTDAAVNIAPDGKLFTDIIENAVGAMRALGVEHPTLALVCGKENVDPNMPITSVYAELAARNAAGWLPDATVYGPIALDGAVSPSAARTKGIDHADAGNADAIVVPDLAAGNMLHKSLTIFAGLPVGSVVLGAKAPIIISSRSDSAENKLLSIALGAAISRVGH